LVIGLARSAWRNDPCHDDLRGVAPERAGATAIA